jgi:hypothetical protein
MNSCCQALIQGDLCFFFILYEITEDNMAIMSGSHFSNYGFGSVRLQYRSYQRPRNGMVLYLSPLRIFSSQLKLQSSLSGETYIKVQCKSA